MGKITLRKAGREYFVPDAEQFGFFPPLNKEESLWGLIGAIHDQL